jgi:hypothetical protein
MANFRLNVNTDAAIILTAKLERMNKSAFPSAVRSTLNDAAFAMKQKEILDSAKLNMTVRNPSFFKRFTGVKRANGFNVDSMYSEVGFQDRGQNSARKAINKGMESNEVGGQDDDGGMYIGKSRTAKGLVKRNARFDKAKVLKTKSKSNVARMYASAKSKKQVFINTSKGRFLVQVKKFERGASGGNPNIKLDFLMRHRKQHIAKAKATHFNKEAALKTQKQMDEFYLKNATYQFSKFWK